jgi:hypothetical protein
MPHNPSSEYVTQYSSGTRTGGELFFPGTSGRPLTLANIDKNFRRFLWQAAFRTAAGATALASTI